MDKLRQLTTNKSISDRRSTLFTFATIILVFLFQRLHLSSSTFDTDRTYTMNSGQANQVNQPVVIAVLTQIFRDYRNFLNHRSLHLPASYVKWLESSGAQVLPVLLNQTDSYYEQVFSMSHGLLLPGGDNLLDPKRKTPMLEAARKMYKLAIESNDKGQFYPIWGTCLGMELLTVLSSNKNTLASCHAEDLALKTQISQSGRLFKASSKNLEEPDLGIEYDDGEQKKKAHKHRTAYKEYIMNLLQETNNTYHFHHKCITDESLAQANLDSFYEPLAYSYDVNGLKFISIFEAKNYPIFAVQFHPEKPQFEHQNRKLNQKSIPHSKEAIEISRYFADFFIQQAKLSRKNVHSDLSDSMLIYNFNPIYLAPKGDMYEQRYIWPYVSGEFNYDLGEYIDRRLEKDEIVDEELS